MVQANYVPAIRERIRPALHHAQVRGNAGLELDRYLERALGERNQEPGERNRALHTLLDRVKQSQPHELYAAAWKRWHAALHGMAHVEFRELEVEGRLIVGLGNESVRDTGITLHRVYGVPYIPGSALKGLARRYANAANQIVATNGAPLFDDLTPVTPDDTATDDVVDPTVNGDEAPPPKPLTVGDLQRAALTGTPDNAAQVTFFDAWYVPDSADGDHPLHPDVITVHHPGYYGQRGERANDPGPWDFDDPNPVSFVAATGRYLVAVRGPDDAWAAFAFEVLKRALAEWGVGAKTSSGYGRLVERPVTVQQRIAAIEALPEENLVNVLETQVYPEMHTLLDEDHVLVAQAIRRRLEDAKKNSVLNDTNWGKVVRSWAQRAP